MEALRIGVSEGDKNPLHLHLEKQARSTSYPASWNDTDSKCAFCVWLPEIRCGRTGTGTGPGGQANVRLTIFIYQTADTMRRSGNRQVDVPPYECAVWRCAICTE